MKFRWESGIYFFVYEMFDENKCLGSWMWYDLDMKY